MNALSNEGISALSSAIVSQAIKDITKARKTLALLSKKDAPTAKEEKRIADAKGVVDETTRFFKSEWFEILSDSCDKNQIALLVSEAQAAV